MKPKKLRKKLGISSLEKNLLRSQGFTLTEILIVVAIMGLLIAIAIPSFVDARERSVSHVSKNNVCVSPG